MKRLFGILAFLAFVAPSLATATTLCSPNGVTVAQVPVAPVVQVQVNGACFDLSNQLQRVGDKFLALPPTEFVLEGVGRIELNTLMNPDPFISFGATTTNLVAGPVTYSFLFGTPIVPGFYDVATSTGGVSVTNGASGTSTVATSAVFPFYISGYGTLGAVPTNLGVDLGNVSCTAGPGAPFTLTSVCNQGSTQASFPSTFYDNLEVLLTYTQNDVGSVASWSGAVTINTSVPEPASMVLIAVGAVALAAGYGLRGRRPRV